MSLLMAHRGLIKKPPLPVRRTNLVLEYEGGKIMDTSGSANKYDGILNGSPNPALTTGINGETNGAWDFVSANSQYINSGLVTEIQAVTKISISAWMKKTTGNFIGFGNLTFDVTRGNTLNWSDNNKIFGLVRDGDTSNKNHLTSSELGNWTHFCLVYDTGIITLYMNNVIVGSVAGTIPSLTSSDIRDLVFLGRSAPSVSPVYMDGQIGPVHIYDDAINAADVQLLFELKTI